MRTMGVRGCGIIQTSMNEEVVPTKLLAAFRATHSGIFLQEDDMSSVDPPLPCHTVYFFLSSRQLPTECV